MKRIIFIFIFLLTGAAWSNNYCEDVFNRLVNSTGNLYNSTPTLTIVKSDHLIAETYATGEIKVGSRLIDLCRRFGKDSANAMAHILAHELAHFYQNHSWISNFTSAYANIEWSGKLNEQEQLLVPVYETQADELGFFYALNAGFQTWKVSSQLLDSIYVWYQLPADLKGYPPLEQRKKISEVAQNKVTAMVPLLRISNYFILIGKYFPGETQFIYYESAGYCLDHLVHENIKTPNVLNNLGALYFLQAQPYFYEPLNKLRYPLVLDVNTSGMDMSEITGTKGLAPNNGELGKEALELLEKAKDAFTQALKSNKTYIPANLNLGLVHFVLKEEGSLSDKIKYIKGLKTDLTDPFKAALGQLEAFDQYLNNSAKKMSDAFKVSIKLNDNSASWNNDILSKASSNKESTELLKWTADSTEKIFGKKVNDFFKSFKSSQETRLDPYHEKFILWTDKKTEGSVYTFRSLFPQTVYRDLMFFEVEDINFETSKGLKLSMTKKDLLGRYGNAFCENITDSGIQYLYPSQSMIIKVDHSSQLVSGITYYGIKK